MMYLLLSSPRAINLLEVYLSLPSPLFNLATAEEFHAAKFFIPPSTLDLRETTKKLLNQQRLTLESEDVTWILVVLWIAARDATGWSTLADRYMGDRFAAVTSALDSLAESIKSDDRGSTVPAQTLWHTIMLESKLWSITHTVGVVSLNLTDSLTLW